MNWLEQRIKREELIRNKAPELWEKLVLAVEGATETYRAQFDTKDRFIVQRGSATSTTFSLIRVPTKESVLNVILEASLKRIRATRLRENAYRAEEVIFEMNASEDGQVSAYISGKPVTMEQISQLLLEPIFFEWN